MSVELVELNAENRAWLQGAYPLFIYDLTEYGANYQMDDQGVWQPNYLDYWMDDSQPVLVNLIRANGCYVGFSFMGHKSFPFKSESADNKICEFFLMRHARRGGMGSKALELLAERPGIWELEVLHSNIPAISFWRKNLAGRSGLQEVSREQGLLFRFQTGST